MNALTSNRTRIRRHNGTLFACNRRTGLAETTVARLLLVACSTTASATQHLLVSATHTCPSHTNTCICMHFQSICIPTRICYAFSHWRTADRQLFSFVLFLLRCGRTLRFGFAVSSRAALLLQPVSPALAGPFIYSLASSLFVVAAFTRIPAVNMYCCCGCVRAACMVIVLIN